MSQRTDGIPEVDAILLPVGAELHALELTRVREVLSAGTITEVPGAPTWLEGLANIRGDIVPVVNTARAFGIDDAGAPTHIVVADTENGPVGVAASGAPRSSRLGPRTGASESDGGAGRHLADGLLCTLLDLDALTGAP